MGFSAQVMYAMDDCLRWVFVGAAVGVLLSRTWVGPCSDAGGGGDDGPSRVGCPALSALRRRRGSGAVVVVVEVGDIGGDGRAV